MKTVRAALVLLCLAAAARLDADELSKITYGGGDGSTIEKAIVEQGVKTDGCATAAEYAYLRQHFPHYNMIEQSLLSHDHKSYDLLVFTDAAGKQQHVYFDITSTFGSS
jgi:hypothetical protein